MLRKADPRANGCPSEKGLQPRCILVSLGIVDISFSMDLKSVNCKKKGDSLKHVNTSKLKLFFPAMDLNIQLALSFHQEHMSRRRQPTAVYVLLLLYCLQAESCYQVAVESQCTQVLKVRKRIPINTGEQVSRKMEPKKGKSSYISGTLVLMSAILYMWRPRYFSSVHNYSQSLLPTSQVQIKIVFGGTHGSAF